MMNSDPDKQSEETEETSFGDILREFESHAAKPSSKRKGKHRSAAPAVRGTVVGVSDDFVLIDYGAKSEGVIPSADLKDRDGTLSVKRGDSLDVSVTGYNKEGMATLSRVTGPRPRAWGALPRPSENKEIIAGRVTGAVKGGFTVDVGTRAFMPASRSGTRSQAEMEQLVGQE